jgi:FMN phosphatase YigB (HAD superfamily)
MNKYIALDIGNVLLHFDVNDMVKEMSQFVIGYQDNKIKEEIALSTLERIQASHDVGLLNFKHAVEEFLIRQDLVKSYQPNTLSADAKYLINKWNDFIKPNQHMLNFLKKLKENKVKIALLSNMGKEHYNYIKSTYPDIFSHSIEFVSFKVGARKPTKLYYSLFIQEYPDFKHCLYLDDIQDNIDASVNYLNGFNFNLDQLVKNKKLSKTLQLILNKYISE